MNRKQLKQRVIELEQTLQQFKQSHQEQRVTIQELRYTVEDYERKWEAVTSWVDYLQPQDPMRVLTKGEPTIAEQSVPEIKSYPRLTPRVSPTCGRGVRPTLSFHNMYLFKLRVEQRVHEELTVFVHYTGRDYYVTANYAEAIDKAELERQIAAMLAYELRGA